MQVLGLDIWNGSATGVDNFRAITGVTFPLLLRAASRTNFDANGMPLENYLYATDYSGVLRRIDDIIVADQQGIIRFTGESIDRAAKTITELLDKPAIETRVNALTLGSQLESGVSRTFTLEVINSGTAPLDITGVRSDLSEITTNISGISIPPGESHEINVTVTPAEEGALLRDVERLEQRPCHA